MLSTFLNYLMSNKYKRKEIAEYLNRTPKMISSLDRKLDDGKLQAIENNLQW